MLALAVLLAAGAVTRAQPPKKDPPQVEIVFCIDTTGSMGDMLDVMCEKVFAICGKVKAAKQNPDLKVGLVAYKDRGDVYVTKATTMTSDLDFIYGELKGLTADGKPLPLNDEFRLRTEKAKDGDTRPILDYAVFHSSSRVVAISTAAAGPNGVAVQFRSLPEGKVLATLDKVGAFPNEYTGLPIAYSRDGTLFGAIDAAGRVRIWRQSGFVE
jgi:hypothetical protein